MRPAIVQALDSELCSLSQCSRAMDDEATYQIASLRILRAVAFRVTERRGMPCAALSSSLLFRLDPELSAGDAPYPPSPESVARADLLLDALRETTPQPGTLGRIYEGLLGQRLEKHDGRLRVLRSSQRKNTGSYYTPTAVATKVVERALEQLWHGSSSPQNWRICDPALGAGEFLLELGTAILEAWGRQSPASADEAEARRKILVTRVLHGVDLNPRAVAVSELALWWLMGLKTATVGSASINLRIGDALLGPVQWDTARHIHGTSPPIARPGEVTEIRLAANRNTMARDVRHLGHRLSEERHEQRALPFGNLNVAQHAAPLDWAKSYPDVNQAGGFDLVIGNPPWVAYAGRAARPLAPEIRAAYRTRFAAWRGYPTLHALFVERAAALAPGGVVALLLPSPLADLDGYRAARRTLGQSHVALEPMLEFGQDAFIEVVQPCFALIAGPRPIGSEAVAPASGTAWRLEERTNRIDIARAVPMPRVLGFLAAGQCFPAETFKEYGFQTTSLATQELLSRNGPDARFRYPLLEGRDIHEFRQEEPRVYLDDHPEQIARARCRLRPQVDYERVDFVVRQTAKVPIAALHGGHPFRNSLLAGFASPELSAHLLVGLLNSALYRALHLALRRDARQGAFPQVKISHLRALPAPPVRPVERQRIAEMCLQASSSGIVPERRHALDEAVFDLFSLDREDRASVLDFLHHRIPQLGHGAMGSA